MQGCNTESQNDFNFLKDLLVINHDRFNQRFIGEKMPLKHKIS